MVPGNAPRIAAGLAAGQTVDERERHSQRTIDDGPIPFLASGVHLELGRVDWRALWRHLDHGMNRRDRVADISHVGGSNDHRTLRLREW